MINKVKGTYDVLPNELGKWYFLEQKIKEITKKYHYYELRTPIMEYSNVFHRETELSDMVTKETYNFVDKGNRDVTLRPEGTAGIIRSYVENKLYVSSDLLKVYYVGPMFRYERPQKGRYRQFNQFGLEAIGSKSSLLDAELIKLSNDFIESLGLENVTIQINSIGDSESRTNYLNALVSYLTPFYEELSNDSKERFKNNPLRILDSKDLNDQKIIENAPKPIDYLSSYSKKYLDDVLKYLEIFNVKYNLNNKLVRGLDYYNEVVFEVLADIKGLGNGNVLGGGGRYENLVSELGGPQTSAIGIAFGIERLLLAIEHQEIVKEEVSEIDSFIITFSENEKLYGAKIFNLLRDKGFNVDLEFNNKNFKQQLKKALAKNSKTLIIIGENELKNETVTLKNTKTEIQTEIKLNDLITNLEKEIK